MPTTSPGPIRYVSASPKRAWTSGGTPVGRERRHAWISSALISVNAPGGGGSASVAEKPAGDTALPASPLAELKPGAKGAHPCRTPTATNEIKDKEKRFNSNPRCHHEMNTFANSYDCTARC